MSSSPETKTQRICDSFADAWKSGKPPKIVDYLSGDKDVDSTKLLNELIVLDLEFRKQKQAEFNPLIYTALGDEAVKFAAGYLDGQMAQQPLSKPLAIDDAEDETEILTSPDRSPKTISANRIGRYKLLQKIGEGGMGTVWMVEQEEPVRRRAALKLIKTSIASKQVIARFEAERQALAMMDHANIAKVLDAGTTDSGSPYFVMELVQGIPINEYCDRNKLTPDQRLQLFVPVCKAIQHAHQKGIIHRDLKPSNVLVQMYDGEPVPKVIDFGLAKALQHQVKLTEKTMFTEYGQVVGTLQYMSPEQATMDALNIDTRTDIYSLGVMLYELLIGSTPVQAQTIKNAALIQVLQAIQDTDPPRPSQRLSSSGEAISTISETRQIQPFKLRQMLRGELDWIVMKALQKDRTRRYETANDFAKDIHNYLNGDAVVARPPSTIYRLRKYAAKNKSLVASFVSIACFLVVATVVSTWFAIAANDAKKVAVQEREAARESEKEATLNEQRARKAELEAAFEAKRAQASDAASKFQLAQTRSEENRISEARDLLEQIPKEHRNFEWYYSRRKLLGSDVTCYGHTGEITHVAYSHDGSKIATASLDSTIKIWDSVTGEELISLSEHNHHEVFKLAFLSESQICSVGKDEDINKVTRVVLDISTGRLLKKQVIDKGRIAGIGSDGSTFAIVERRGRRRSGKILRSNGNDFIEVGQFGKFDFSSLRKNLSGKNKLILNPDNSWIAGYGSSDRVEIWKVDTATKKIEFETDNQFFESKIKFSPGSEVVAIVEDNRFDQDYVVLYDAKTGKRLRSIACNFAVDEFEFSPDGRIIAALSGADDRIDIVDVASGEQLFSFNYVFAFSDEYRQRVVFSPDGARLAALEGNVLKILDVASGTFRINARTTEQKSPSIGRVEFNKDSSQVALACGKYLDVFDVATAQKAIYRNVSSEFGAVTFSPDGKKVATNENGFVTSRSSVNGKLIKTFRTRWRLFAFASRLDRIAFSLDGCHVISKPKDGLDEIKIWDLKTGKLIRTFKNCYGFALSPDGSEIAGACADGIRVWGYKTGKMLRKFEVNSYVDWIDFSRDGGKIISSSILVEGGDVEIRDSETGKLLRTITNGGGMAKFSPDGTRVAYLQGGTRGLKIWDWQAGREVISLRALDSELADFDFSHDGKRIVGVDFDGVIQFWDAFEQSEFETLRGHTDEVIRVDFSSDGNYLLTESESQKIVWDFNTRTMVKDAKWDDFPSSGTQNSPDGRWFVTQEGSHVILVDREFKNITHEKNYRAAKARFNVAWHRKQARLASEADDDFAVVFHYAWLLRHEPENRQYYAKLHAAYDDLLLSYEKNGQDLAGFLSPVVKDSLDIPQPEKR